MNTVENVNPDTLFRRYFANREKFQQELHKYRKAVSDLHFNEILINSLKRSLAIAIYPNWSDVAWRIRQEIQILKEKRIYLNSIVKTRKQNMQVARVRANKYVDLYKEVRSMDRLGEGKITITVTSENNKIYVAGVLILESGEEKTFTFER